MSSAPPPSDPDDTPRPRSRRRWQRGRGPVAALALGLFAAACSSTPDTPPARCPKVAIVYGLDTLSPVEQGGRALPAEARLLGLQGSCGYDDAGLELAYSVDIIVKPTAPIGPTTVELPYFVAVSAPDGTVIDKQVFTARIEIDGSGKPAGSREQIAQTLEGVGPEQGPMYKVLVGFELPRSRAIEQWRKRGI